MDSFFDLSTDQMAVLSASIAVLLSKGLTGSEQNVLGNFVAAVGATLLTIAAQGEALANAAEAKQSTNTQSDSQSSQTDPQSSQNSQTDSQTGSQTGSQTDSQSSTNAQSDSQSQPGSQASGPEKPQTPQKT